jgi:hypothetical protein
MGMVERQKSRTEAEADLALLRNIVIACQSSRIHEILMNSEA